MSGGKLREYTYEWYPEHYSDNSKPILKITKSSFGSFQWCPKKYEFSYPLRLPQTTSEAMLKDLLMLETKISYMNIYQLLMKKY